MVATDNLRKEREMYLKKQQSLVEAVRLGGHPINPSGAVMG
jgi:hypothetical protein